MIKEKYGYGFSDYFKKHNGEGRIALRRLQWQTAQSGNPTMQIWLGKQYLGQSDKQEIAGKDGGPIETKATVKLETLSDKELDDLERIVRKATEPGGDTEGKS